MVSFDTVSNGGRVDFGDKFKSMFVGTITAVKIGRGRARSFQWELVINQCKKTQFGLEPLAIRNCLGYYMNYCMQTIWFL